MIVISCRMTKLFLFSLICVLKVYQTSAVGCSFGCEYCRNGVTCITCIPGYYLSLTGDCQACPQNCASCTTNGCLACKNGQGVDLITGKCGPCAANCYKCSFAGTCSYDSCYWGFTYNSFTQICDACASNCNGCLYGKSCYENQCYTGYTFNSTSLTCTKCAANCDNCLIAETCVFNGCSTGYGFNSTTQSCFACPPKCLHCLTRDSCLPNECAAGTYYNETSQLCEPCADNCKRCLTAKTCLPDGCAEKFVYNATSNLCEACAVNCMYCSVAKQCDPGKCYYGFNYNASTRMCDPQRCAPNCHSCELPNTCYPTMCKRAYTFDEESQTCLRCADNCNYCISNGTCTTEGCATGYSYVFDDPQRVCARCDSGKECKSTHCNDYGGRFTYDVAIKSCVECTEFCNYCSTNKTCLSNGCHPYYTYDVANETCKACAPYCRNCATPGTCLPNSCYEGSVYNSTTKVCDRCLPQCSTCKTANTCLPYGCSQGFTYNLTTGTCNACIPNCATCNADNTCTIGGCFSYYRCFTDILGYRCVGCPYVYNMTTNTCDECAPYCTECSTKNTCLPTSCITGYTYDPINQTCKVNSPCNYNSAICNYKGSCSPSSTTPYYTCTCYKGYDGLQCEKKLKSPLYPHGSEAKDNVLLNTDDGSTPRILFDQSFLFFGRFLTSAFVNMNGFLSFSMNYLAYRPMPFPHNNSEEADILAPFWADADSSGVKCDCTAGCSSCGTDVVYYHIYKFDSNRNYPTNSTEHKVLQRAKSDGKEYLKGFKRADWVMVVTWSQTIPYPYSANQNSMERNKFQLVLAMDNTKLKSFVSFRYESLLWNSIRPAVMGIQATKSNITYNFGLVYLLASHSGAGTVPSFEEGVAIFDTTGSTSSSPGLNCLDWVAMEVENGIGTFEKIGSLPPCPCSGFQAMFSPSHVWMPGTDCFVTTTTNFNGVAMKCCYDRNVWMWSYHWSQWSWMWTSVWLGNLIIDPIYEAGGLYEQNPYYNPNFAITNEEKAKKDCCLLSANCPAYYSVRPINTCEGFIPRPIRSSFCDPHISTFDGNNYDYNGIGEYWLINSTALQVQVRTVQAKDINNKLANASVFGAYAIQVPQSNSQNMSDRIFIRMISELDLELFVLPQTSDRNSAFINLTDWFRNGTNNTSSPDDTIAKYTGFVLKRLSSAKGVVVNIVEGTLLVFRLEAGQLGITVTAGPQLFNNTRGLLGTYDGNVKNDFTLRNGSVLPTTASQQIIYSTFGESWRLAINETLMYYDAGKEASQYQNTIFTPMFTPKFSSTAAQNAAKILCGSNSQCLLDYAATGNAKMAGATVTNSDRITAINKLFSSSQPIIRGQRILRVTVGKKFTTTYTKSNADKSAVTLSMSGLPTGATFNPTTGVFTWTPLNMAPVFNLSVDAISANGVPALSISVAVLLCSGCTNKGSCDFNSTTPSYSISYRYQKVTCTCFDGFRGANCNVTDDQCVNQPCGVNGTCISLPPGQVNEFNLGYNCTKCQSGQQIVQGKCIDAAVSQANDVNKDNACSSTPCQNNANCQASLSAYTCTCPPELTGINCETILFTTTPMVTSSTTSITTPTTTVTTTTKSTKKKTQTTSTPKVTTTTMKTTTANPFYEMLRQKFGLSG